jgi:hypothetical protein
MGIHLLRYFCEYNFFFKKDLTYKPVREKPHNYRKNEYADFLKISLLYLVVLGTYLFIGM